MQTKKMPRSILPLIWLAVGIAAVSGCGGTDDRLVQQANENAQRQAAQNREMAKVNREVAEGTKRLVAADAEAHEKVLSMQHEIQQQHSQLETDRRALAQQRIEESILGPILTTLGLLLVASLPLFLCGQLMWSLKTGAEDSVATDLLVEHLEAQAKLEGFANPQALLPSDPLSIESPAIEAHER